MKSMRHQKILKLISEYSIDTQEELLRLLKKEGFDVTQATVSRDINELRLIKTLYHNGKYKYTTSAKDTADDKDNYLNIFSSAVTDIDNAQNIIVVKTLSGMAQAVGASIDSFGYSTIVGTLAGDDTIFVACRTNQSALNLVVDFKNILN